MTRFESPLVVVLGNEYDAADHAILFPRVRQLGVDIIRVHPNELVTRFDTKDVTFWYRGDEIKPQLVIGWVYEDILHRGMQQLEAFERAGVPVINNARTLFCGQNKYLNTAMLHAAGVPHLPVVSGRDRASLGSWLDEHPFPLVSKPLGGFGGNGIRKITSQLELEEMLRDVDESGDDYYLQPYVENPGRDIRVLCVNFEPIVAVYRYAAKGAWITNTIAGGTPAPMDGMTDDLRDIARRASEAIGARISGVDVTEDLRTGTLRIFETNTCPSSEPNFSLMDRPPVALYALADYVAAVARTGPAVIDSWRPAPAYA
jgi:[lysine-biosynthesis-protein LysW]--L-2-aminoadipate ligase/ribosomal protein S6--L-glutamate ligase